MDQFLVCSSETIAGVSQKSLHIYHILPTALVSVLWESYTYNSSTRETNGNTLLTVLCTQLWSCLVSLWFQPKEQNMSVHLHCICLFAYYLSVQSARTLEYINT